MFERFEGAGGIIFDCDGCLLDSMGTWRGIEDELIRLSGHDWTQPEIEEMRSGSMSRTARLFHERYGVMESADAIIEYENETLWDYYSSKAELKPGAAELVGRLDGLGIPCVVVSSTAGRYLRAGLSRVGILDKLYGIFSTQETGLSKSEPDIYLMALRSMGVERPGDAWGFDDSVYALRTMAQVGIPTVGTYDSDDAGTFGQLTDVATLAVRSLEELLG